MAKDIKTLRMWGDADCSPYQMFVGPWEQPEKDEECLLVFDIVDDDTVWDLFPEDIDSDNEKVAQKWLDENYDPAEPKGESVTISAAHIPELIKYLQAYMKRT